MTVIFCLFFFRLTNSDSEIDSAIANVFLSDVSSLSVSSADNECSLDQLRWHIECFIVDCSKTFLCVGLLGGKKVLIWHWFPCWEVHWPSLRKKKKVCFWCLIEDLNWNCFDRNQFECDWDEWRYGATQETHCNGLWAHSKVLKRVDWMKYINIWHTPNRNSCWHSRFQSIPGLVWTMLQPYLIDQYVVF